MSGSRSVPRVIAITDRKLVGGTEALPAKVAALPGIAIMLREKDLAARELFSLGQAILNRIRPHGGMLIVNDRIDVALALDAGGVHLGGASLPTNVVRHLLPERMLLGVSCHSAEDLASAASDGADYALLSPVFKPSSKQDNRPTLGIDGFRRLAHCSTIPVLALGGISAANESELREAGAHGYAAIGAFFSP